MSSERPPTRLEIDDGLAEIRIRQRLFWFLAAGLLVVFGIFSAWAIAERRWHKVGPSYLLALLASSVVVNIAWCRAMLSRCPRCGKRFYFTGRAIDLSCWRLRQDRCAHCDLRLNGKPDTWDDPQPG